MFNQISESGRHIPEHPLPSEIAEMPHDATVCQFCGVSYLIHHEMKKLEDKVADLGQKLVGYEKLQVQEKAKSEEIERNRHTINHFEKDSLEKANLIESMSKDLEQMRIRNEDLEKQLEATKTAFHEAQQTFLSDKKAYLNSLQKMQNSLLEFRRDYHQIRKSINDILPTCSDILTETEESFIKKVISHFQGSIKKRHEEMEVLQNENLFLRTNSCKLEKEINKVQEENDKFSLQLRADSEKSKHFEEVQNQMEELVNKVKDLEAKNRFKSNKLAEVDQNLKFKQDELDELKARADEIQSISHRTIKRLEEEHTSSRNKVRQTEEDVKRLMNDVYGRDEEITLLQSQVDFDRNKSEALQKNLDEARESAHQLIRDRETLITQHQQQLDKFSREFEEKLKIIQSDADHQEEIKKAMRLEHERKIYMIKSELDEIKNIRSEVKANELEALQRNNKIRITEMEKEFQDKYNKQSRELATCRQSLTMAAQEMKEQMKEWKDKEQIIEHEKESLKKMVSELEDKISKMTMEKHNVENILELKDSKERLKEMEEKNSELNQRSKSQSLQIKKLEDTVRRECEERFELLGALQDCQARLINKNVAEGDRVDSDNSNNVERMFMKRNMPVSAINNMLATASSTSSQQSGDSISRTVLRSNSSRDHKSQVPKAHESRSQTVLPVLRRDENNHHTAKNHHQRQKSMSRKSGSGSSVDGKPDVDVDFLRRRIAQAIKRR